MKKNRILFGLLLLLSLLFTGCGMRTVDEMYALPKRSQEFQQLQTAIDEAMATEGLSYCAPLSGENQQSVQSADLDGDGREEHLVFATGGLEKPLQVLIFRQDISGACSLMEIIQSSGTAFEQVEYVNFDEKPGMELVIGRQVSDQVLRSMSVYSFSGGSAELVLMNGYSKFITCDLNENGRSELIVLRPGEEASERAVAVRYSTDQGSAQRDVELELSAGTSHIRRITRGRLHGGTPAVYVSSAVDESAVVTDVLALRGGKLVNIPYRDGSGASIQTLRNYYVYPEDIDGDGILELPALVTMKVWDGDAQKFLLRWYAMDREGREVDKMFSFHDFLGGWYMELDSEWATRVTVEQDENQYTFYVWNETYEEATAVFTVCGFTGSGREEAAGEDGWFVLYRGEEIIYSARLEPYASQYGITQRHLIESFAPIYQEWQNT